MGNAALFIGIGLAGGFLAGLLGLGGTVLLVPLLLVIPPALGYAGVSVHAVAAVSLVHLTFAAGRSVLLQKGAEVNGSVTRGMGMAGAAAALLGGSLSAGLPAGMLLLLFALTATVATGLLLVPRGEMAGTASPRGRGTALLVAGVTGVATGLVGAAGGFLLVPFLQYVLRVPAPAAQGSALRIVLASALAGLAGKALTGQVPPGPAAALVLGALPAAWWGGEVADRLDPRASVQGPYLRPGMREDERVSIIRPDELQRLISEGRAPQMIDVREGDELAAGRIPGVLHIPLGEFEQRLRSFTPAPDAVIVCRSGRRSGHACEIARRAGHAVRNMEGGMLEWKGPVERGYPIV